MVYAATQDKTTTPTSSPSLLAPGRVAVEVWIDETMARGNDVDDI